MAMVKITFLVLTLTIILMKCCATPGHHVRHRIHVPHKVKTVYHTKIIKVPEHHHHIYEKEKPHLIKVPEHHHYFHEKEKEKLVDLHDLHKDDDHSEEYNHQYDHVDFSSNSHHHSVFKKHAPHHLYKSKKRSRGRRIH